jgi:HTH-type transcriptional regulator, global nitrogen regulator NrpRI
MNDKADVERAILRAMQEFDGPVGASRLTAQLQMDGLRIQPRTVRHYLLQMDREGVTRFVNRRRGRELTSRGRQEIARGDVYRRVGFIAGKIDSLTWRMRFDLDAGRGSIITNVALLEAARLPEAMQTVRRVLDRRWGMGRRMAVAEAGGVLGNVAVPSGYVALGPVCSITLNGILLSERIPVTSRYGGLLEVKDGKPLRLVELIEYSGTSLDPLEMFIHAGMTRVGDCARTGTGVIGVSVREFPAVAMGDFRRVIRRLDQLGLGGILAIGRPNQPIMNIPITDGRVGFIVAGGLNPIAALCETGIHARIQSLAGLADFASFHPV